jgi:hypothetical protein
VTGWETSGRRRGLTVAVRCGRPMPGLMPLVRKLEARLAADVEFKGADG